MTEVPDVLAVTMGEPAGIGAEITLKAWMRRRESPVAPFFVLDDPQRLENMAVQLGWSASVQPIEKPADAVAVFGHALPVLPRTLANPVIPGQPDAANANAVIQSIADAVAMVRRGEASAVVTNPVHKKSLYASGFQYPGHTEFLAALSGEPARPVMMLTCPGLRVVLVTTHTPLAKAVATLTTSEIVETARITIAALKRDFGIDQPHLAVAGLNPHAGEGGDIGREEIDIIAPAVDILKREGSSVRGPVPADSLFHPRARETYDAAICMYHDQALIPLKTISFHEGVNVTLGLPFVRTSPDHGTAFEIAGTGIADERSLVAAMDMAAQMVATRQRQGMPLA